MPKRMTVTEVAAKRNVSRGRIIALIREGRLKAEKIGMQFLIDPADERKLKLLPVGRPKGSGKR